MPLISVLIPAYNVDSFIGGCLESLKKQTFRDFEVIIVNDGSTDRTRSIIEQHIENDRRFMCFNQKNSGVVKTRKLAAIKASGKYVVVVDGDDFIGEEYLQEFAAAIDFYHPDVIISGYCQNSPSGKEIVLPGIEPGFYDRERCESSILTKVMENEKGMAVSPTLWAKCFRLELYKKWQLNVEDEIKMGEDSVCVVPCLIDSNSVVVINSAHYFYNFNPTSLTHIGKVYSVRDPVIQAKMLYKSVDLSRFDYMQQFYRMIVRHVFVVACSLFNQEKPDREIKLDINCLLSESDIKGCIKNCHYSMFYLKGIMMRMVLKYRIFPIMKYYAKNKI